MNMDKNLKLITAIKNTLNTVSVEGVENMRKVLLCYDTLENLEEVMFAAQAKTEENEKEDSEDV